MGRPKKYKTEEERKAARKKQEREANRRSYQKHKEKRKQYQQEHKEEIAEYQKQYRQTPMGRAVYLLSRYRQSDKNANRGECTLTPGWIVDNIFTQKCHWCPETDWTKIGCDRIHNELPHTPDNVIPCCERCNSKRGNMTYEEFKEIIYPCQLVG